MPAVQGTRAARNSSPGGLVPWLSLIRPPNAFTVPGDVVAGWFLAGGVAAFRPKLFLLIASSLSIYGAGLILNDCFDLERDRKERPDRPLPSGRIAPALAWSAGILLLTLGILLAALTSALTSALGPVIVAAGIGILVLLYNGPARKIPALGFLTMGLCRGANLLLGASMGAIDRDLVLFAAGISTAYITAVTWAAASEAEGPPRGAARWAPLGTLVIGLPLLVNRSSPGAMEIAASLLIMFAVIETLGSLRPDCPAAAVPPKIGALIRLLIPLQCTYVLIAPGDTLLPSILLLSLFPLSILAGRRFYGS